MRLFVRLLRSAAVSATVVAFATLATASLAAATVTAAAITPARVAASTILPPVPTVPSHPAFANPVHGDCTR